MTVSKGKSKGNVVSHLSPLNNPASERAVLAGLTRHGIDAFVDVEVLLTESCFNLEENKVLYTCIKKCFKGGAENIDFASVIAAAEDLSLSAYIDDRDVLRHFKAVFETPIHLENVRDHAVKLRRLDYAREMKTVLHAVATELMEITGDESLDEIQGIAESKLQELALQYIREDQNTPITLKDRLREHIEELAENPVDQVGIASGFPAFDKAIGGGLQRGCVDVVGARPKALRYGSAVYTPMGCKNIEDVEIGDTVINPTGGTSVVTDVWDHDNIDIYRVTFRDGDHVDCCEDHLWEVFKRYPYKRLEEKTPELKSIKELENDLKLRDQEYKWDVRLTEPVEFEKQEVPIHPYVMGLLLGDGSFFDTTKLHVGHQDVDEIKSYLEKHYPNKVKTDYIAEGCVTLRINGLLSSVKALGLHKKNCHTKFIPSCYLNNSSDVRLEILRGLMDSDGDCTKDGKFTRCRYCTTSVDLARCVKYLVQSLGGLCSIVPQTTSCNGKKFESFRCEIRLPKFNPFRLKRKYELVTERNIGELKRTIVNIEKLNIKDNARCLTLDHQNGLFLTEDFIVTHNTGKSVCCDNVAINVAEQGIPVLVLDTEMSDTDHYNRLIACKSNVPINEVRTGQFATDPNKEMRVNEAVDWLEEKPYHYMSICGRPFEETLAIIRRWLMKEVGYEGSVLKDCVVIYDYLKLMSGNDINNNLAEFQLLGFQITSLHNLAKEYDFPCLSFIQLNRDGEQKESTAVASGSDRLIWLCTSFSIFKTKTPEEIAADGVQSGNRKLVPIVCRHGPGMEDGYICMNMQGDIAKLTELGTVREIERQSKIADQGFEEKDRSSEDEGDN